MQGEGVYFQWSFMLLSCNFIRKWTLSQELFQSVYLDFEWLLSSFGIPWIPLKDSSSLEAAIRNYGKI